MAPTLKNVTSSHSSNHSSSKMTCLLLFSLVITIFCCSQLGNVQAGSNEGPLSGPATGESRVSRDAPWSPVHRSLNRRTKFRTDMGKRSMFDYEFSSHPKYARNDDIAEFEEIDRNTPFNDDGVIKRKMYKNDLGK